MEQIVFFLVLAGVVVFSGIVLIGQFIENINGGLLLDETEDGSAADWGRITGV